MLYGHYKLFVQERAGLGTEEESEKAIRAVFEVLDMLLPVEVAARLAETLPLEIRDFLGKNRWQTRLEKSQFLARIAQREDVGTETAESHARAVLSVLAEFLASPELLISLEAIPREIRRLFNRMNKGA